MMPGLKLLITSGATREPIDEVRYISNVSTGKTGAKLARFFAETGFDVTYVRGEGAAEPGWEGVKILGFTDYQSLDQLLKKTLSETRYFAVIHLAAVSDYSVRSVMLGERSFAPGDLRKVDSGEEMALVLKRNSKILDRLKEYSGGALVVGFKLTHSEDPEVRSHAVQKLAASGGVDLVVHNDLGQIRETIRGEQTHLFQLHRTRGGSVIPGPICSGVEELGTALVGQFREF